MELFMKDFNNGFSNHMTSKPAFLKLFWRVKDLPEFGLSILNKKKGINASKELFALKKMNTFEFEKA